MSSACKASSSVGAGSCSRRQPLAQQDQQVGAVARRLGERDLERRRLRRPIALLPARLVMHQQAKAAHERMLRRQPEDEPRQQQRRAVQHLLAAVGAGEQLEPAFEQPRRDDRHARIGTAAEGRVDLGQQRLAEAPRQAGARQAEQVADGAQPHSLERFPVLATGAEQPHRRMGERRPRRREIETARRRIDPRQHRRTLRGGGDGDAQRVAERRERLLQALQQGVEAAEVAQARLHLEQHGVRRRARLVRRLQRRPAA